MTRWVIWDLGGVVFRYLPDRRLKVMAAASPQSECEIDEALWRSGLSRDADRGVYDATHLAAEARRRAALAMDDYLIGEAWLSAFEPDEEVVPLLDRLRPDLQVASFSNNGELVRLGMELHWPDLLSRFEPAIWSYEIGMLKPEHKAYQYVDRLLGVPAPLICFIDDSEANVVAAREVGWDAIHFTDAERLRAALDERGLLGRVREPVL